MDPPQQTTAGESRPSPVAVLFFFIMMMMYVSPSGNETQLGRMMTASEYLDLKLARETSALDALKTTQWGDFSPRNEPNVTLGEHGVGSGYLNITGFRQDDGYSWGRMKKVQQRFDVFRKSYGPPVPGADEVDGKATAHYAVYHNVSGVVAGPWVRSQGLGFENQLKGGQKLNISHINQDTNWAWHDLNKNITGMGNSASLQTTKFDPNSSVSTKRIRLPEREKGDPRMARASLTLVDEANYGGWEINLYGLHWPETGMMALTTSSDKFDGLYGLPHLMSSSDLFDSSQRLLNETLGEVLAYRKRRLGQRYLDFWSDDTMLNPAPHCEYVVLVQIHAIAASELPPSSDSLQDQVFRLEHELRQPDGMPGAAPPPLRMSFVAFSPDCDTIIESKGPPEYAPVEGQHLKGYKSEAYISKLKMLLALAAGVMFLQAFLLLQQSKDASTPSTSSRISVRTIALMMFVDFVVEFGTMMTGAAADAVYPIIYITAFASLSGLLLGGRFLGEVYRFQAPERQERARARVRAQVIREAPATQARADYWNRRAQLGLPIPEIILSQGIISADGSHIPIQQPARPLAQDAVQADNQPIIVPSDQDVDAEIAGNNPPATVAGGLPAPNTATATLSPVTRRLGSATLDYMSMFAPAFMLGTLFFLITISSLQWPPWYRAFYLNTLSALYLGMWWPQIFRNVKRNYRKSLKKTFVVGTSFCRLAPFAYIHCYKDNLAFAETRYLTFTGLAAWVWIQIVFLFAQEVVGARLGMGEFLGRFTDLPEAWDYHPILKEDELEGGGMPIGLVLSSNDTSPTISRSNTHDEAHKKSNSHHSRSVDCAICQNVLEVPIIAASRVEGEVEGDSLVGAATGGLHEILERRKYMVTPCRHVFHSECLEGWMRLKLQCPTCRSDLPAL